MKFHLQTAAGQKLFSGHGAGYVAVNGVRYVKSLVVTPVRVLDDWQASDFDQRAQEYELEYLKTSHHAQVALAEQYAGLPFEDAA